MTPTISVQDVFRIIHDAVAHGVWWPLAGLALVFVVAALRKVAAAKMGRVGAWLATDHGAIALAFLTAGFSGVSAALLGGATPSKATLIGVLLSGATAVFAFPKVRQFVKSWFGVDLGLGDLTGNWQVTTAPNGKQSVVQTAAVPPATPGVSPPPPPRTGEGGFLNTRLLWLIIVLSFFGVAAVAFAGCACNPKTTKVDGSTCAYQVLTAVDAVNGAAARTLRKNISDCDTAGKALLDAGKIDESNTKYDQCHKVADVGSRVIIGTEDSVQVAADGVAIGEKAGQKDFTSIVSKAVQAGRDMVTTLKNQGVQLQATITAILGGL